MHDIRKGIIRFLLKYTPRLNRLSYNLIAKSDIFPITLYIASPLDDSLSNIIKEIFFWKFLSFGHGLIMKLLIKWEVIINPILPLPKGLHCLVSFLQNFDSIFENLSFSLDGYLRLTYFIHYDIFTHVRVAC